MTDDHLTVDDARRAAGANEHGNAHCPACNPDGIFDAALRLAITENGNGPNRAHYECSQGCRPELIEAQLRTRGVQPGGQGRDAALAAISAALELTVTNIVKHGRSGDAYDLVLAGGRTIRLGNATKVLNRAAFVAAVYGQADKRPVLNVAEHGAITDLIAEHAERRDTVATDDEETLGWLASYAHGTGLTRKVDLDDKDEIWDLLGPGISPAFFTRDGRLCLRLDDLAMYVNRMRGQRITTRDLSVRLSNLDFTKPDDGGQLAVRRGTETRKARYWISPASFEDTL